jgi:hypothetical protein
MREIRAFKGQKETETEREETSRDGNPDDA